jgi:hypothetical protein
MSAILWAGVSIFITGSGSRLHFDRICDSGSDKALDNFRALSESVVDHIPLARTVANALERICPEQVGKISQRMIRTLLRNRVLEQHRLFNKYYRIAIDATGWMSFAEPHCEYCLTREHKSGKITYYHPVLEAKLVTETGMALSIATEFIENVKPNATKQDCELKGLPRLLQKIRDAFPQLPICLLLDGLYANQTAFKLCKQHKLEFVVTFKRGSLPSLYSEFETLRGESSDCRKNNYCGDETQVLAWVNDLNHGQYKVNALSCQTEDKQGGSQYFAWLTSFKIGQHNAGTIANKGGRLRWKIENEGFNVQKNCEYQMEHTYSHQLTASKNYYLLIQVAHILLQLLLHGLLYKAMNLRIHELRNFFRLIKEHFCNRPSERERIDLEPPIQIRLNSS